MQSAKSRPPRIRHGLHLYSLKALTHSLSSFALEPRNKKVDTSANKIAIAVRTPHIGTSDASRSICENKSIVPTLCPTGSLVQTCAVKIHTRHFALPRDTNKFLPGLMLGFTLQGMAGSGCSNAQRYQPCLRTPATDVSDLYRVSQKHLIQLPECRFGKLD